MDSNLHQAIKAVMMVRRGTGYYSARGNSMLTSNSFLEMQVEMECIQKWSLKMGLALRRMVSCMFFMHFCALFRFFIYTWVPGSIPHLYICQNIFFTYIYRFSKICSRSRWQLHIYASKYSHKYMKKVWPCRSNVLHESCYICPFALRQVTKIRKLKKDLVGVVVGTSSGGNAILNWPGIRFQHIVKMFYRVKTGFTTNSHMVCCAPFHIGSSFKYST